MSDNEVDAVNPANIPMPDASDSETVTELSVASPEKTEEETLPESPEKQEKQEPTDTVEIGELDDEEPPMKKEKPTIVEITEDVTPDVKEIATPIIEEVEEPEVVDLSEKTDV